MESSSASRNISADFVLFIYLFLHKSAGKLIVPDFIQSTALPIPSLVSLDSDYPPQSFEMDGIVNPSSDFFQLLCFNLCISSK